ncbi:transcriptional coactivator p15/PC4 family protein [Bradyrhizobium japonicum]|uniref:transcriptional coactivator p15/PC4 family protein n=1 Tax=Bradyrhizobium japonicum TaxID=375 RepID=UPI001B89EE7E|nr:transcriptional coactivator p15/PC4 family protein [Bradyrhizobium japonicum]MBR0975787.1 transcriptional coactivator p15/PC4 family protein [Bradyrhizobium japonicum]
MSSTITSSDDIKPTPAPAQYSSQAQLRDGIHLAAIWRGPRDRSRAVQFALKEFNGHQLLDVRQYESSSGFMIPTKRGLTISVAQLGKFAAAAGAAYRQAIKLGLITAGSSS